MIGFIRVVVVIVVVVVAAAAAAVAAATGVGVGAVVVIAAVVTQSYCHYFCVILLLALYFPGYLRNLPAYELIGSLGFLAEGLIFW